VVYVHLSLNPEVYPGVYASLYAQRWYTELYAPTTPNGGIPGYMPPYRTHLEVHPGTCPYRTP